MQLTTKYLELEVQLYQAEDVLSAILHSIVFTRLFRCDRYQTVALPGYRLQYCKCTSEEVDSKVDAAVASAIHGLRDDRNPSNSCTISVMFFDRPEKRTGWLTMGGGSAAERGRHCWEQWQVTVRVVDGKTERETGRMTMESLLYIASANWTAPESVHDAASFPFKIVTAAGGGGGGGGSSGQQQRPAESLASLFKRMLTESSIPPLLGLLSMHC